MPEPEEIARQVAGYFHQAQRAIAEKFGLLAGKRVVITAGPTREAIDPVRYISNHSTGKMGFALAAACYAAGAKVTLIAGPVSLDTPNGVQRVNVASARQMLDVSMESLETGCDIFIATAAVADYRVAEVAEHKIKKAGDELNVSLVKIRILWQPLQLRKNVHLWWVLLPKRRMLKNMQQRNSLLKARYDCM